MHAFDVLADPVRRRTLELLQGGELSSGEVVEAIQREFGISQPAVSQHLKVLRDAGFVSSKPQGSKRIYQIEKGGFYEIDRWLESFRSFWETKLDALGEDIAKQLDT